MIALAAVGAASVLSAQTPATNAPPRDEIVVLGRWDNPVGVSRSASQGVAGNAEIEARPRLRAGEILEVVPGLIVTQHSGSGKSNQMFLRGFNLDHGTDFATFVDGMPVNLPTHGHVRATTRNLRQRPPPLLRATALDRGRQRAVRLRADSQCGLRLAQGAPSTCVSMS